MRFEVLGQPQGKQRAKVSMVGGFARAYTPEKTVSYENTIYLSYLKAMEGNKTPFWELPITVNISAYYAIPKSFSKKKHAEALNGTLRPLTKPDIDNVVKVVCDALNNIAYRDDTHIVRVVSEKYYSDEPKLIIEINEFKENERIK